jgi:hypothetical protein
MRLVSRGIATITFPGIHLRNICVTSPQRSEQATGSGKRVVSTAVNWISDRPQRRWIAGTTCYDPISTLGEAGQKWWSDQT